MKVLIPVDLKEEEFNWTAIPIIGLVLTNAEHDSLNKPIEYNEFYYVGKHKETGKLAIIHVPDYSPESNNP